MDETSRKERELQDLEEKKLIYSYDLNLPSKQIFCIMAALANTQFLHMKLLEKENLGQSLERWFELHPEEKTLFENIRKEKNLDTLPLSLQHLSEKSSAQGLELVVCADVDLDRLDVDRSVSASASSFKDPSKLTNHHFSENCLLNKSIEQGGKPKQQSFSQNENPFLHVEGEEKNKYFLKIEEKVEKEVPLDIPSFFNLETTTNNNEKKISSYPFLIGKEEKEIKKTSTHSSHLSPYEIKKFAVIEAGAEAKLPQEEEEEEEEVEEEQETERKSEPQQQLQQEQQQTNYNEQVVQQEQDRDRKHRIPQAQTMSKMKINIPKYEKTYDLILEEDGPSDSPDTKHSTYQEQKEQSSTGQNAEFNHSVLIQKVQMEMQKTVQDAFEDILPKFKQSVLNQVNNQILELKNQMQTIVDILHEIQVGKRNTGTTTTNSGSENARRANPPHFSSSPSSNYQREKGEKEEGASVPHQKSVLPPRDAYENDIHREQNIRLNKFKQEGFVPPPNYDPKSADIYRKSCLDARLASTRREQDYIEDNKEWIIDLCGGLEFICNFTGLGQNLVQGYSKRIAKDMLTNHYIDNGLKQQFMKECENENFLDSSTYNVYSRMVRMLLRTCVKNVAPDGLQCLGDTVEKLKKYCSGDKTKKQKMRRQMVHHLRKIPKSLWREVFQHSDEEEEEPNSSEEEEEQEEVREELDKRKSKFQGGQRDSNSDQKGQKRIHRNPQEFVKEKKNKYWTTP